MARNATELKMPSPPVWVSMLLGLLVGFLPLVGMEPAGGAKPTSNLNPSAEPLPSPSGSNCSQLTLKLEFSSKVVEHGENLFAVDLYLIVCLYHVGTLYFLSFLFGLVSCRSGNLQNVGFWAFLLY